MLNIFKSKYFKYCFGGRSTNRKHRNALTTTETTITRTISSTENDRLGGRRLSNANIGERRSRIPNLRGKGLMNSIQDYSNQFYILKQSLISFVKRRQTDVNILIDNQDVFQK